MGHVFRCPLRKDAVFVIPMGERLVGPQGGGYCSEMSLTPFKEIFGMQQKRPPLELPPHLQECCRAAWDRWRAWSSVLKVCLASCRRRVWRSQARTCSKLDVGSHSLPATHCSRVQGPSAAQGISSPSCSWAPFSPTHTNVQDCMGMPGLVLALVLKLMCLAFLLQLICLRNACWIPWPLPSAAILVWRDKGEAKKG